MRNKKRYCTKIKKMYNESVHAYPDESKIPENVKKSEGKRI